MTKQEDMLSSMVSHLQQENDQLRDDIKKVTQIEPWLIVNELANCAIRVQVLPKCPAYTKVLELLSEARLKLILQARLDSPAIDKDPHCWTA
jgi:hypothetical protein